jgi:beta-galactosidase
MKLAGALVCVLVFASVELSAGKAAADSPRQRQWLTTDWKFLRGAAEGAEQPSFDDGGWRRVDLPHDWSIEDLPPRGKDLLFHVVTLVPGQWRFQLGDDAGWKAAGFDNSGWREVQPPAPWSRYGVVGNETRTGWYRRRFTIPPTAAGKSVLIELGRIQDADETYVDGVRADAHRDGETYWTNARVEARVYLLRGELGKPGEHVVAVRVQGKADGGLVAAVPTAPELSPCDLGRSAGGINTGYAVGGTGWYRKRFTLPARDQGKTVRVVFDGAYLETTVWLNGARVGRNVYGYTPFGFDLTAHLKPAGEENLLAVRVDNPGANSRWYTGSGLYRPAYLEIIPRARIALWGAAITTPEATAERATVRATLELENVRPGAGTRVRLRVIDPDGKPAGTADGPAAAQGDTEVQLAVRGPRLWSPESPALYRAEVELLSDGKLVDRESVPFGLRTIGWGAERGLLLNGRSIKLKGGCVHHDHGLLGAASYPAAEERRVRKLKAAGYNAIRCSHNPPAASFLDACDRLGMLVIDETFDMWNRPNNPEDYHRFFKEWWQRDVDAMVRRDRNHPSVIMWSIGNEITERFEPLGVETAKALAARIRSIDSTRPVTSAFNDVKDEADPYLAVLDIAGYNYSPGKYEYDHGRLPNRVMFATESFARDSFAYWDKVLRLPYVIGDFIWTAWDYRGESGIGHTVQEPKEDNSYLMPWPWHNAFCGDFDVCGFEKPQSLYRQVLWGVRPIAVVVERPGPDGRLSEADLWGWRNEHPSWTWPGAEGQKMAVRVYGAGDEASLALDGKELARKPAGSELTTEFRVAYRPGKLTARLIKAGRDAGQSTLATSGRLAALRLTAEQRTISAGRDSLAFVAIEAVDAGGNLIPVETGEVSVQVAGPGLLLALGNGDPTDVGSVQDSRQKLWQGRALAVIRSNGTPGTLILTAKLASLPPAKAAIAAVR